MKKLGAETKIIVQEWSRHAGLASAVQAMGIKP